jgi:cobalt-zinc-cadmium efflux system membrane fusion protein
MHNHAAEEAAVHKEHDQHGETASNKDHGSHEDHGLHEEHGSHEKHGQAKGHDEHEEVGLKFTPRVLEEFGIELGTAGPGTLHEEVGLPGEIRFNRANLAYATPRYAGTVRDIQVKLGGQVEKGDVLAILESVETLRPFEVKAPFDGVVVSYDITLGQTVEAGTRLFTVADLSTVWADLQIYQKNFGQIRKGQRVRVTGGHTLPTFLGTIDYVAPTVDEHTRTGLARVVVDNQESAWKPGMFIQGKVSVDSHTVDIRVPRAAVLTMENARVVFVQTSEGFEPRPIQIGHADDEYLQVLRGLTAGETYVTQNPISLKAEMSKGAFGGHNH